MTITLGSLNLGEVANVVPTYVQRFAESDIPLSRGRSKQLLGSETTLIELEGVLTGSNRYENLRQLNRYRMIGESLKLDSPSIETIVFLKGIKPPTIEPGYILYGLDLEESRFKQANACDATADWTVDSGGGALTAITSTPTPLEGSAALKLSGTIAAATASRLKYNPADLIDLGDESWITFWFRTNKITDLTSAYIKLYTDAANHADYDFHAMILAVDTWYRIRINKDDFTVTGSMEYDNIGYITIDMTLSSEQAYYFVLDDLGGFE